MESGEQWPSDGHQRRLLDCLSKEPSVATTPIVLTVPQVASALEVSRSAHESTQVIGNISIPVYRRLDMFRNR